MSKRMLYALILMALVTLVFIFSRGKTEITLIKWNIEALTSVILLIFTGIGIAIGILLK